MTWRRHRHNHDDEFAYLLEGELALIEDEGETVVRKGNRAPFPNRTGNGHPLISHSDCTVLYLEIGSRQPDDLATCSDVDMMSANADRRFVRKDSTPHPDS